MTVYRKTSKGSAEIERRLHGLSIKLRSVLIMVDGRRDDTELRKLAGAHFDSLIDALVVGEFVEAVKAAEGSATGEGHAPGQTPAGAPRPGSAAVPRARLPVSAGLAPLTSSITTAAPAAAPAAPSATTGVAAFLVRRRDAVRQLHDLLGPSADPLTVRIERATSPAELLPLLQLARHLIASARGPESARVWQERFIDPAG